MEPMNEFSGAAYSDPTEVVELALIEARYLLLEANMNLAVLPHHVSPPVGALRDMSPFGR